MRRQERQMCFLEGEADFVSHGIVSGKLDLAYKRTRRRVLRLDELDSSHFRVFA